MRDVKKRIKVLSEKFSWDKNEAGKVWAFGPLGEGPNLIIDQT